MKVLGCLVAVLLIISSMIALIPIYTGDSRAQDASHYPIVINSDADFAAQAESESWLGNGSSANPYIIEDYDISVTGTFGIDIRSTRAHFILRSIQIQGVWGRNDAAIYLFDVQNGVIRNCTLEGNTIGIHLNFSSKNTLLCNSFVDNGDFGILLSNGNANIIAENNISDYDTGIYLEYSDQTNISFNSFAKCQEPIYLQDSHYNKVTNNHALGGFRGLHLDYSYMNHIANNIFADNDRGITFSSSESNTLSNNTMTGGGIGIMGTEVAHWNTHEIYGSNNVNGKPVRYVKNQVGGEITAEAGQIICANATDLVIKNHAINGGTSGIQVGFSSNVTISNNTINDAFHSAISLERSRGCLINRNHISENNYGIELWESDYNSIEDNNISNNLFGMVIFDSKGDFITGNHVSDNEYGIGLSGCIGINLTKNEMVNDGLDIWFEALEHTNSHYIAESNTVNGKPIYYWKNRVGGTVPEGAGQIICANCTNIDIRNQEIHGTLVGINLYFSPNNRITNNTIRNSQYGIKLSNSDGNVIKSNQLSDNSVGIDIAHCQDDNVSFNTFSGNLNAMELYNVNESTVAYNNFSDNGQGVSLSNCFGDNITGNNIVSCNWSALGLDSSESCVIAGNLMSRSDTGLGVYYGNQNVIVDNEATNNQIDGISLYQTDDNLLQNNKISNNTNGLSVWSSHGNEIEGNFLYANSGGGIILTQSESNNIASNILLQNNFDIDSSNDNTITNNTISESGFFITGPTWEPNINQIDSSNTVNGKPLYYWTNRNGGEIPSDAGQVILENCTNIKVANLTLSHGLVGIMLRFSSSCELGGNFISNGTYGIYLHYSENINITSNTIFGNGFGLHINWESEDNYVKGNTISQNRYGLYFEDSIRSSIIANNISENEFGLHLGSSDSNIIHHNNFIGNMNHLNLSQESNVWDNGNGKGNYWDDYQGVDTDGDGVGDTEVPHLGVDEHPLMAPADITKDYDVVEEGHGQKEEDFPVNPLVILVEVVVLVALIGVFLVYFFRTQKMRKSTPSSAWERTRARWKRERRRKSWTFSEKGFSGKRKRV